MFKVDMWFAIRGRRGRDRVVVEFTINCAISAYHHKGCEFESRSWRGAIDATLYDKVWHCLATGLWFSPGTPVSSTNKTDCHDITEILLNGALNAITLTPIFSSVSFLFPVFFLFLFFLVFGMFVFMYIIRTKPRLGEWSG